MGSSALNEKPDEEEEDRHKGYVPQFDVTGQGIRYHLEAATAGATAGDAAAAAVAAAAAGGAVAQEGGALVLQAAA
jgi:hypothetical protein